MGLLARLGSIGLCQGGDGVLAQLTTGAVDLDLGQAVGGRLAVDGGGIDETVVAALAGGVLACDQALMKGLEIAIGIPPRQLKPLGAEFTLGVPFHRNLTAAHFGIECA